MKEKKLRIDKFTVARLNNTTELMGGTQVDDGHATFNDTEGGTQTDDKPKKDICIANSLVKIKA